MIRRPDELDADYRLDLDDHGLEHEVGAERVVCPCGCGVDIDDVASHKTSAYLSLDATIEVLASEADHLGRYGLDRSLVDQILDASVSLRHRVTGWCHGTVSSIEALALMRDYERYRREVLAQLRPILASATQNRRVESSIRPLGPGAPPSSPEVIDLSGSVLAHRTQV